MIIPAGGINVRPAGIMGNMMQDEQRRFMKPQTGDETTG